MVGCLQILEGQGVVLLLLQQVKSGWCPPSFSLLLTLLWTLQMCCFVVISFKKKKERQETTSYSWFSFFSLFFGYLSVTATPCVCFQLVLIIYMAVTPQTSFWSHALGCWVLISPSGIPPAAFLHSYSAVMWSLMDPAMPYVVKSTLATPHRSREDRGVKKPKKTGVSISTACVLLCPLPPPSPLPCLHRSSSHTCWFVVCFTMLARS